MREKFVPDFHECISKSGLDEEMFTELMKYVCREYEEKMKGKASKNNCECDVSIQQSKGIQ
jgi:hypothetical protein